MIYIYEDITSETASRIADEIGDQQDVEVRINSFGGDVAAGLAIYNLLRDRNTIVHIDGIAASIASVIAMAGSKVIMSDAALMYVHKPVMLTYGNEDDHAKSAEDLAKVEQAIRAAYLSRVKDEAMLDALLAGDGTTLTAQEAFEAGLIDEIDRATTAAAAAIGQAALIMSIARAYAANHPVVVENVVEKVVKEPVETRELFTAFYAEFGDKAAEYYAQNLSIEDARKEHIAYLDSQVKKAKEQAASVQQRAVAMASGAAMTEEDFWAAYRAIKDPREKTLYYNEHFGKFRKNK